MALVAVSAPVGATESVHATPVWRLMHRLWTVADLVTVVEVPGKRGPQHAKKMIRNADRVGIGFTRKRIIDDEC
jgi:hypothetical protein